MFRKYLSCIGKFSKLHTAAKTNLVLSTGCPAHLSNNNALFGMVVIQEWWGFNQSILTTADKIAKKGFKCLTPDLFRGKVAQDKEEAGHLLSDLDWNGAVKDIDAAALHLKTIGCTKVGVIGFCMGGALAIASINTSKYIDAAAPFYGVCDLKTFPVCNANGPIFGQFGENDDMCGFSSPEDAERLLHAGREAGKDVRIKMWHGVGHAFMNQDRKETYDSKVARQALDEVVNFFKGI